MAKFKTHTVLVAMQVHARNEGCAKAIATGIVNETLKAKPARPGTMKHSYQKSVIQFVVVGESDTNLPLSIGWKS